MALRDLWTHPARRTTETKADRATALDYSANRMQSFYSGQMSPRYSDYHSYLESYKLPWVRACVQVISYNAANVRLRLVIPKADSAPDDDDPEVDNSPLLNLVQKPNPWQSGFEFFEMLHHHLELTGNAYITLESATRNGLPTELYLLPPDRVSIMPDPTKKIAGYRYTVNGKSVDYSADEIIHVKYPNPVDPAGLYGMGVIEAGETRFDSDRAMAEHERDFWRNGAKITGVLETTGDVSDTMFARMRDSIRAFFRNSGISTLLLENGITYKSVSDGPAKLGLIELATMSRDQILAMFGVPATKLGILEKANYKADEADRYFWTETIDPKLTRLEQALSVLVEMFHPGSNYELKYERLNFTDDLPQMQIAKAMTDVGLFTADEIRKYCGYPPLEEFGDKLVAGVGLGPLDLEGAMATVNERRAEQNLPPIEGGDEFIILPARSVPLDIATGVTASALGGPGTNPIGPQTGRLNVPAGGNARQPQLPEAPNSAGNMAPQQPAQKRAGRASLYRPASSHLLAERQKAALERGLRQKEAIERFFAEQEARVLNSLAGYKKQKAALSINGIWDTVREWKALFSSLLGLYNRAVDDGAAAAADIGASADSADRFSALEGTFAQRVQGISETTRQQVEQQLTEGLRRGYSTTQIAQGVPDENYAGITGVFQTAKSRAEMIARTETMYAFNSSSVMSYRESGVVQECEIMDGDFDETCADRDGQVVSIDDAMDMIGDEHPNGTLSVLPLVDMSA